VGVKKESPALDDGFVQIAAPKSIEEEFLLLEISVAPSVEIAKSHLWEKV
jgi:hypothetical protein